MQLFSSNTHLCYRSAEKRPYTITVMPIDESTLENDCWLYHPTKQVAVNEDGTHLYNLKSGKFSNISLYAWTTCDWKKLVVSVDGKVVQFSRLALECFIGRELFPKETCEHIDCDRTNNRKKNLIPRYRLFQANARKMHKLVSDDKVIGVLERQDGRGWSAHVRMYTLDGRSASVEFRKYFFISQYGSSEKAKEAAIAFRQKHFLRDGMVYV